MENLLRKKLGNSTNAITEHHLKNLLENKFVQKNGRTGTGWVVYKDFGTKYPILDMFLRFWIFQGPSDLKRIRLKFGRPP